MNLRGLPRRKSLRVRHLSSLVMSLKMMMTKRKRQKRKRRSLKRMNLSWKQKKSLLRRRRKKKSQSLKRKRSPTKRSEKSSSKKRLRKRQPRRQQRSLKKLDQILKLLKGGGEAARTPPGMRSQNGSGGWTSPRCPSRPSETPGPPRLSRSRRSTEPSRIKRLAATCSLRATLHQLSSFTRAPQFAKREAATRWSLTATT